jgi:hypothetical protein
MAQAQEIYAQLFLHVDAATSQLLEQELIDAEIIRAENQRIFAKLGAVQEAATLQCSQQASVQEAELRFSHGHNVPTEAIRLDDEVGLSSIPGGSSICASAKSLDLDDTNVDENAPNESTPSSTNSPRTLSDVLGHRDTSQDEVLRVRSHSLTYYVGLP